MTSSPLQISIETRIEKLELELEAVKQRNNKVEADKAWETSNARINTICLITYVIAAMLLYFIGSRHFLLDALLPTAGFFLSTRSLPAVKRWWLNSYMNKTKHNQI